MAKANVSLGGRDILDLDSLSIEEYEMILQTAAEMKKIMKRDIKKVPSLRGKSIINLFYEPSTRTRTSFELAGKYLGADVVNITTASSSVVKVNACAILFLLYNLWLVTQSLCAIRSRVPLLMLRRLLILLSSTPVTERMHILLRDFWICLPFVNREKI